MRSLLERPDGWDGHLLLLHGSERDRRAGVAAWVRSGLQAGAKLFYIEPRDVPAERSLRAVLRAEHVAADGALADGQVEVVAAGVEAYEPAWQADVTACALRDGYAGVWWSGEASTAWTVMSPARHHETEAATDTLCQGEGLSVLCQYSTDEAGDLGLLCRLHSAGVRETLMSVSLTPEGSAVSGEVDVSNHHVLRAALANGAPADRLVWTIDLGGLEFLDVGGTRSLAAGTAGYRDRGGQVRLHAARSQVRRVLETLGIAAHPGLSMEGA